MENTLQVSVKVNKSGLRAAINSFRTQNATAVLKKWAVLYRTFLHDRYLQMAKGGWRRTKPDSLRRRIKNIYGYGATMIDTGDQLFVLTPVFQNHPGAIEVLNTQLFTVTVGYGGDALKANGKLPIATVAYIHNYGLSPNPKRQILVRAPRTVIREMESTFTKVVNSKPVIVNAPRT